MALAGAGLAFSVVSTGVFLYPLISGLLKPNPAEATVVAITIGSTGILGNTDNMQGNIPSITLFAEDGTAIGRALGNNKKTWAAGTTNFVSIQPYPGLQGRQSTYVTIEAGGNDAICISAVSVAWPDNTTPKVWLGDIGVKCSTADNGPFWANSVTQTGSDPEYQSKCVWVDGDGTNGIPTQGFQLHIVDFGRTDGATTSNGAPTTNPVADQWNDNNDLLCKAPGRMNFYRKFEFLTGDFPMVYQPPLKYNLNGTDADPNAVLNGFCKDDYLLRSCHPPRKSKRSSDLSQYPQHSNMSESMASTIVHSTSRLQSAEELCHHPASWGPSFVSHYESKYCDMSTRILWPLCSKVITSACFDAESETLVLNEVLLNGTHRYLVDPQGKGANRGT